MKNMDLIKMKENQNTPDRIPFLKAKIEEMLGQSVESFMLVGSYSDELSFGITYGSSLSLGYALLAYIEKTLDLLPLFQAVVKTMEVKGKTSVKLSNSSELDQLERIIKAIKEEVEKGTNVEVDSKALNLPIFFYDYPKCSECGYSHPTRSDLDKLTVGEQIVTLRWLLDNKHE